MFTVFFHLLYTLAAKVAPIRLVFMIMSNTGWLISAISLLFSQKKIVSRVSDKKHKLSDIARPVLYSQTW